MNETREEFYLTCEKYSVFELLIFAAGMMGAYTYNLWGGVFSNAQTGNVVLMSLAFGKGRFGEGVYYLIPFTAYLLGTVVSEVLPAKVRRTHLRWDTLFILFEICVLFLVGFIPLTWPPQVVQITINFLCSMQYNTFRQAEGIPMATTFVTNHVRQAGVGLARAVRKQDAAAGERALKHLKMVAVFFAGGFILTAFCDRLKERSIWLAVVPLGACLALLLYSDLVAERQMLGQKPHGH